MNLNELHALLNDSKEALNSEINSSETKFKKVVMDGNTNVTFEDSEINKDVGGILANAEALTEELVSKRAKDVFAELNAEDSKNAIIPIKLNDDITYTVTHSSSEDGGEVSINREVSLDSLIDNISNGIKQPVVKIDETQEES